MPENLAAEEVARAVEIVDGDTLVLDDGRNVRLVGIQAPKLPLGRRGFQTWPLADEAKAALAELTLGRELRLAYGGRRTDRHGRALAHLETPQGHWVQGALLAAGLARVYSFADNRAAVPEMLALESQARLDGRGIWALDWYAVRDAETVDAAAGGFQLVEGRVRDAAEVRGRVYLNYGADWRSDFTVFLDRDTVARFRAEGIDPLAYEYRRLRVRGWVKSFNGPMIEVTHSEQIEVLSE
jgi:endonuclease YncB( thermonuclease family)